MKALCVVFAAGLLLWGAREAAAVTTTSTAYCPGESSSMTASGRQAQVGFVAVNALAIGTWIEMQRPRLVMGRRWFRVMDRGGMADAFAVDFWGSCAFMQSWGRRTISYRVLGRGDLYRGLPAGGWRVVRGARSARLVWEPR